MERNNDPIELWGGRIGRGLAVLGALALCFYLYVQHVR
jgi:hypothetical protein